MKKTLRQKAGMAFVGFCGILLVLVAVRQWIVSSKIALKPLLPGQLLDRPVDLAEVPDGSGRFIVIEKGGHILWFERDAESIGGTVLDIQSQVGAEPTEEGLLGFTFHPDYPEEPYFYAYYNRTEPFDIRVSRFLIDPESLLADPSSELVLIEMEKRRTGHNGGQLVIGPDKMLYISVGENNLLLETREKSNLFGKILRIDVRIADPEVGYQIPPDNPFVNDPEARGEIWAYGFRNPWRFSIDEVTGELYTGDVGFLTYEEINRVKRGRYYGWPIMEGPECYQDFPDCTHEGELPLVSFPRLILRVVIGGFVYRGQELPQLQGKYIFGDFFRGIFSIPTDTETPDMLPTFLLHEPMSPHPLLPDKRILLSGFAQGLDQELYALDLRGAVYQLVSE